MGGHSRIVAPNLLQQRLPRDRALAGPVEIAQDRGLLLGQADFTAFGVEQELRAWPKRVRPDGEDRVLARLVLAKLGADAREQHGKAERLGDVIVGARFKAEDGVGIGVVPSDHDDRRLETVFAQDAHGFAACTPLLPFSAVTASNSSCSESCSVSASRSSASSSTIRILRVFGINSDPRRRFAAPLERIPLQWNRDAL